MIYSATDTIHVRLGSRWISNLRTEKNRNQWIDERKHEAYLLWSFHSPRIRINPFHHVISLLLLTFLISNRSIHFRSISRILFNSEKIVSLANFNFMATKFHHHSLLSSRFFFNSLILTFCFSYVFFFLLMILIYSFQL